jgi:hypothetical protein
MEGLWQYMTAYLWYLKGLTCRKGTSKIKGVQNVSII